jgi:hypothetical protein
MKIHKIRFYILIVLTLLAGTNALTAICEMVGTIYNQRLRGTVIFDQENSNSSVQITTNIEGIRVFPDSAHRLEIHLYGDLSDTINGSALQTGGAWSQNCGGYGDLGNWQANGGFISETRFITNLNLFFENNTILGRSLVILNKAVECGAPTSTQTTIIGACVIGFKNLTSNIMGTCVPQETNVTGTNLILNGGFESCSEDSCEGHFWQEDVAGDLRSQPDVACFEGNKCFELSHPDINSGSLSQNVFTVPGFGYVLSWMMGVTDCGPDIKEIKVSATGSPEQFYTIESHDNSKTNPGWVPKTYAFIATLDTTTITFTGETNFPDCGALIDQVELSPYLCYAS